MGYNTQYSLRTSKDEESDEYLERLGVEEEAISIDHIATIENRYNAWFGADVKWYLWEENMREYSAEHPNTIFELSGQGEEPDDIWRAYFKNGLCHKVRARIVYDEYDETQLK